MIAAISLSARASGVWYPSSNASALGATMGVHPAGAARGLPPSQGRAVDALRPACASWMPAAAPCACRKRVIRSRPAICSSFHNPRSSGLIRPRASTAVASVLTRPAPPTARLPRWTRCQSFASPSSLEYWHIGETPMRLRRVNPRRTKGSKSMPGDSAGPGSRQSNLIRAVWETPSPRSTRSCQVPAAIPLVSRESKYWPTSGR